MEINIYAILTAGLIPLVIGFIWYNEKVFGKKWMKVAEMTDEKMKGSNMGLIFGLSYLFSIFLAAGMYYVTVHQAHVLSVLVNEPGMNDPASDIQMYYQNFMEEYGNNFRTFKHGVFHGFLAGFMYALPILGINALFERKGFAYIAINTGYWIICMSLMGGVVCVWQ